MSTHQLSECTECGEFSKTDLQGPSGPVCGRCYQWNVMADQLIPVSNDDWSRRKTPIFALSPEVPVA
jgi:hypothetical protein